jgi:nicotinamide mononucleotide (NMN) deamidase PncC/nicotinic acid mononucleotide adenylyltransferase
LESIRVSVETTAGELIRQIHAAPVRLVVAASGGGSGALSALLSMPGASRTVLEAIVPYSAAALIDLLGARPERFCCVAAARSMAKASFQRGLRFAPSETHRLAGIGATASLCSDRPKRGPHRVHVALQTARETRSWSLVLVKGRRTRAAEERICTALILRAAAWAAGIETRLPLETGEDEQVVEAHHVAPPAWTDLLLGDREMVYAGPGEEAAPTDVVFPGAFHPLHEGHRAMARLARRMLGRPVAFELAINNVDKPPLDFLEIAARLHGLARRHVWLTRAATFQAKSQLFPGATFIVGADTILRIADPRYSANDPALAAAGLQQIAARGCQFLVFGRLVDGTFQTLSELDLPEPLRAICCEAPAAEFRADISSTEIRRQRAR